MNVVQRVNYGVCILTEIENWLLKINTLEILLSISSQTLVDLLAWWTCLSKSIELFPKTQQKHKACSIWFRCLVIFGQEKNLLKNKNGS